MDKTELGTRIKSYEKLNEKKLFTTLPIVIRLDGLKFSKFTKGMQRPFDLKFREMMELTTEFLVKETNAKIGYTQSDEISLLLYSDNAKKQIYRNGKVEKINSILAAKASVFFNSILPKYFPEKVNLLPVFDCRIFNVPTLWEGINSLIWRVQDATKNSISMLAQNNFSHRELHKKHTGEMLDMLHEKDINWNEYSESFKRGTFFQKKKIKRKFTCEEITKLPKKHFARTNPNLEVVRSEIKKISMPVSTKIINIIDVFYNGTNPETN